MFHLFSETNVINTFETANLHFLFLLRNILIKIYTISSFLS